MAQKSSPLSLKKSNNYIEYSNYFFQNSRTFYLLKDYFIRKIFYTYFAMQHYTVNNLIILQSEKKLQINLTFLTRKDIYRRLRTVKKKKRLRRKLKRRFLSKKNYRILFRRKLNLKLIPTINKVKYYQTNWIKLKSVKLKNLFPERHIFNIKQVSKNIKHNLFSIYHIKRLTTQYNQKLKKKPIIKIQLKKFIKFYFSYLQVKTRHTFFKLYFFSLINRYLKLYLNTFKFLNKTSLTHNLKKNLNISSIITTGIKNNLNLPLKKLKYTLQKQLILTSNQNLNLFLFKKFFWYNTPLKSRKHNIIYLKKILFKQTKFKVKGLKKKFIKSFFRWRKYMSWKYKKKKLKKFIKKRNFFLNTILPNKSKFMKKLLYAKFSILRNNLKLPRITNNTLYFPTTFLLWKPYSFQTRYKLQQFRQKVKKTFLKKKKTKKKSLKKKKFYLHKKKKFYLYSLNNSITVKQNNYFWLKTLKYNVINFNSINIQNYPQLIQPNLIRKKTKKLKLKAVINNRTNIFFSLNFLSNIYRVKKFSPKYTRYFKNFLVKWKKREKRSFLYVFMYFFLSSTTKTTFFNEFSSLFTLYVPKKKLKKKKKKNKRPKYTKSPLTQKRLKLSSFKQIKYFLKVLKTFSWFKSKKYFISSLQKKIYKRPIINYTKFEIANYNSPIIKFILKTPKILNNKKKFLQSFFFFNTVQLNINWLGSKFFYIKPILTSYKSLQLDSSKLGDLQKLTYLKFLLFSYIKYRKKKNFLQKQLLKKILVNQQKFQNNTLYSTLKLTTYFKQKFYKNRLIKFQQQFPLIQFYKHLKFLKQTTSLKFNLTFKQYIYKQMYTILKIKNWKKQIFKKLTGFTSKIRIRKIKKK